MELDNYGQATREHRIGSLDAAFRLLQAEERTARVLEESLQAFLPAASPDEIPDALDRRERARAAIVAVREAERIARQEFGYYKLAITLKHGVRNSRPERIQAQKELRSLRLVGTIAELYGMQRGLCAYCENQLCGEFHVDHIVPVVRGGQTVRENLCCACARCNLMKLDMTGDEFRVRFGFKGLAQKIVGMVVE